MSPASHGTRLLLSAAVLAAARIPAFGQAVDYHLERISPTTALNQPTYLSQAPGDAANIVYYSTRTSGIGGPNGTSSAFSGFGVINNMGGGSGGMT